MQLYKISMNADFGDSDGRSIWTSRKTDIPRLMRDLREAAFDGDCSTPFVEMVVFKTTKEGILEMLNRCADRG